MKKFCIEDVADAIPGDLHLVGGIWGENYFRVPAK